MTDRREALNKLERVISVAPSQWHEDAKRRAAEKPWKRRSQTIALTVLRTLRARGISQKNLAERLDVPPQQVNQWVKECENFTLETIARLEQALDIQLIEVRNSPKL